MILRTYVVLLACWLTGHPADGLYLKYKISPNTTELTIQTIQRNENARYPRDAGQWTHRNRKKLVVLDRNNKFVAAFIQKLINLIEKERNGDKPKSISKLSNAQKIPCFRSFGHLFNSRFRKCGPGQVTVKPILKLMTVNMVPMKTENVFVDSTRHGSDSEFDKLSGSDTDSSSDTSDYTDDYDFKPGERIVQNLRRQGHPLYRSSLGEWSDDDTDSDNDGPTVKKSKRFEVVTNGKVNKTVPHETNIEIQSDSDEEKVQSDSDSDQKEVTEENNSDQEKVMQKNIFAKHVKAHDDVDDSDTEASDVDEWEPKQQLKQKKEPKKQKYSELSSIEDDSEEKRSKNHKKVKKQSDNYIYLQRPEPVNSDMETDGDTRRDGMNRLQNFFMPKRNIWDSSEIQHLSYYWFHGPQGYILYT